MTGAYDSVISTLIQRLLLKLDMALMNWKLTVTVYPAEIIIAATIIKQYKTVLKKRLSDLNLSAVSEEFFNAGRTLYLKVNECSSSRIKCSKHPV